MLTRGVAVGIVVGVLVTVGCKSSEQTGDLGQLSGYLVYERHAGEKGVWLADADGSHSHLLVRGGQAPAISPNGKWVAYTSGYIGSLFLVPRSGGEPKLVARGQYFEPKWSPRSDRIAVRLTDDVNLKEELVSIEPVSGRKATLYRGDPLMGWSFSPDGKRIVFAARTGYDPNGFESSTIDLFVVPAEGGGDSRQITHTGDSGFPAWGPKWIAFAKLIPYHGWGRHEIWRIQPDGTGRRTITGPLDEGFLKHGCTGLVPVEWSKDGSALLAAWQCEFSRDPVAVDPESGSGRRLGAGLTFDFSSDGSFALVAQGGPPPDPEQVVIYPFAGGKPTVVADDATAPSWTR